MLIQNTSNMAQAPQQPARLANDRPASDGTPEVVVATPSNVETRSSVAIDVPQIAEQQPSAAQLQNAVDNMNKAMKQSNKNLEFSVDVDTHKSIVKLVDTETGEVIRQFPSEEALAISRAIDRIQQGILLKQTA
jgi:flagellar protein FlaG